MTEAVFQAPKRRARVYESYEAPFPVLGYENEADLEQHIYRAEIVNQHVIVRDPKHIEALYGKVNTTNSLTYSMSCAWTCISYNVLMLLGVYRYFLFFAF